MSKIKFDASTPIPDYQSNQGFFINLWGRNFRFNNSDCKITEWYIRSLSTNSISDDYQLPFTPKRSFHSRFWSPFLRDANWVLSFRLISFSLTQENKIFQFFEVTLTIWYVWLSFEPMSRLWNGHWGNLRPLSSRLRSSKTKPRIRSLTT